MALPETLTARLIPAVVARKQVNDLIKREQDAIAEYRRGKLNRNAMPPVPAGDIFVWFDRACYGNGGKGFYYVRFHSGKSWLCTAYDQPALIVKKSIASGSNRFHGAQMSRNGGRGAADSGTAAV